MRSSGLRRKARGRAAPASLHERILADVRGRIVSGEWPTGSRIPNETELSSRFGCSRMTVNKVLSMLARSGLIERRRKAGSFVSVPRSQSAVLEIQDIRVEVESLGLSYGYTLLDSVLRKVTKTDIDLLGVVEGTQVRALSCLHFAGGKPFCLEKRLINIAAVPTARGTDFTTEAPGPWLVAHIPWSEARHVIRAVAADREVASVLDVGLSAACLSIERRTWAAGRPITYVTLTYPSSMRELVATFRPTLS